jgi:hypothetical protein
VNGDPFLVSCDFQPWMIGDVDGFYKGINISKKGTVWNMNSHFYRKLHNILKIKALLQI